MWSDNQLVLFTLILTASYVILSKWRQWTSKERLNRPPSLPSLPVIGSLPFLRNFSNLPEFFMETSKRLGPAFTFRVGAKVILVLNSRKLIEEALLKNSSLFTSRPEIYMERLTNPNSKGIAFRNVTPQWKQTHKTTLSIMKELGFGSKNLMQERILSEVKEMTEYIIQQIGKSFDPRKLSVLLAFNNINSIIFGRRNEYELGLTPFIEDIYLLGNRIDMSYDVAPFLKYVPIYRRKLSEVVECNKRIIQGLERERDKCLKDPDNNCFVLRYIEREGPDFDREQLNFLLREMITGGTDTSAATFRWLFIALANNPDIQNKLFEEIDSVVPRDRYPTMQDEPRLPYVEATILEIYRWRTILPLAIARQTTSESIIDDSFIQTGTMVLVNLHSAHNNPAKWGDPEFFRPERFLDEKKNVINKDSVINFSLGRRSCLGEILARAEVFLVLTSLVQRFIILPPEGQEKVSESVLLPITIVASPKLFSIRFIERQ